MNGPTRERNWLTPDALQPIRAADVSRWWIDNIRAIETRCKRELSKVTGNCMRMQEEKSAHARLGSAPAESLT